jgi:hypothetical protein
MTERPQTLVGETVVIQSFLLLGEPHAPQSETRLTGRQRYAILGVYHRTICITATIGNPDAAARTHNRLESGRQAAGRLNALDVI